MQDIKTQEQKTKLQKNRVPVDKIEKKTIVEKKQSNEKGSKRSINWRCSERGNNKKRKKGMHAS